ncbi:MAG: aminomethyl-transferring glycine dehydrogenase subunit GcvPA [Bacteroidales bacterium]|nr:aminomethyl-transferring glycine dehydrogenase subunit GcvPA [Bacteroidales bacterium]
MSTFAYFPHTEEDIRAMLDRIGVASLDDLYSDVPEDFQYKGEYDLPSAMSEQQVRDYFEALGRKNVPLKVLVGQGAYDHYVPSVIPYITSRSEFLTSYTPYQSEISQGTLRYIFEWQSMICRLTGMDVSNASMYDGPTAAAEALRMMLASTRKRSKVVVSSALLPNVIKVVKTYMKYSEAELIVADDVLAELGEDVAGVMVPGIDRYGRIEDLTGFADKIHQAGALMAVYCDPSTLAVLKSPAEWGADIAVGDGQSLGIPLNYGGPYVGFLACRSDYMRKLPGRIVGQTVDADGKRCFVLTLQAREQHIRREKATSNICSNESLMALWCTVYLSLMGPEGLRKVNELSSAGAHYLHDALLATGKFEDTHGDKPFLNEFTLKPLCDVEKLRKAFLAAGFFAGLQLENGELDFCVTEKHDKEELDSLVKIVEGLK